MQNQSLKYPLFFLRISIFLVMFMWTLDKFIRPEHASAVFEGFYYLSGVGGTVLYVIAVIEMILIFGFLAGFKKTITYGFVFAVHAVSTLSSYKQYFAPFEGPSLLFFAAWPMLAACWLLYRFRAEDTLFTVSPLKAPAPS